MFVEFFFIFTYCMFLPQTHCVVKDDFELPDPPASTFQVARCVPPSNFLFFSDQ